MRYKILDENGCWNGNCEKYIVITGDTTSITDTKETKAATGEIVAYPNPTSGILTVECEDCNAQEAQRAVQVFDSNGKKVMEINLFAPKSTINLTHLADGVYFVSHLTAGQPIETQKVIVHH
jgi:type IX secretion system substrate protein